MNALTWRRLKEQQLTTLELTPLAFTDKTAQATQQLVSVLHGFAGKKRALKPPLVLSLEIIASREQGIRFLAHVPQTLAVSFEQIVAAYLPEVRVKRVQLSDFSLDQASITGFRQQKHYAYPLKEHGLAGDDDPIACVTHL